MTDREARKLLKQIRKHGSFAIRNHDGEWGVRYVDDGYELFLRTADGRDPPAEPLTEDEVVDSLRPYTVARIRAALMPLLD